MISFKVDNLIDMNAALKDFLDFLTEEQVSEDEVFDSRLVSCELITNVIRHCGEIAYFTGGICGDGIVIKVSSENSGGQVFPPSLPDVFAESGRGLYIIHSICGGNVEIDGNEIRALIKRKK